MKKIGIFILVLLLAFVLSGCSEKSIDNGRTAPPPPVDESMQKLAAVGNDFSWRLFREVVDEESKDPNKNVFISPLSASMVLGMIYNGANGETETAMQSTLGFDGLTQAEINTAYKGMLTRYPALDPKVTVNLANSVWYNELFAVKPEFLDINQNYFDAAVRGVDFGSPQTITDINGWASAHTNGRIDEIVKSIPEGTVMYLINALYFKGNWKYKFDPDKTRPGQFLRPDGSTYTCNFMTTLNDSLRFLMSNSVLGVELPYGNGDYRMMLVMPTAYRANLDSLVGTIDEEVWTTWRSNLSAMGERLVLPKFKFSYGIKLNDALGNMGMGVAFSDLADFSDMYSSVSVKISYVEQKTFVQLDEEGTEAAAVTTGVMELTSGPMFVFNRPFLVILYESGTGAILFVGKIVQPEFN